MSAGSACDVAVIGGGLVGPALAVALAGAGVRTVALVPAAARSAGGATAPRPIALAPSSHRILDALGLWPAASRPVPIRRIHVSERGGFGFTRIRAADYGVAALGHVCGAADLSAAIAAGLGRPGGPRRIAWSRGVTGLEAAPGGVRISVDGVPALRAALVVAADGAQSEVRALLGVAVHERDYGQRALTATVESARAGDGTAYERFCDGGPLALLPLGGHRHGLVWTLPPARAGDLLRAGEAGFLAALRDAFGGRVGRFTGAGARTVHPLCSSRAARLTGERSVFVGSAARHLHPVAGQGFNLALRDVAVLAEMVVDAVRAGEDPGAAALLADYARRRDADHRVVTAFTDGLVRIFGLPAVPFAAVRGAGLVGLDLCPPLKRLIATGAMGVRGPQPRLQRALPL